MKWLITRLIKCGKPVESAVRNVRTEAFEDRDIDLLDHPGMTGNIAEERFGSVKGAKPQRTCESAPATRKRPEEPPAELAENPGMFLCISLWTTPANGRHRAGKVWPWRQAMVGGGNGGMTDEERALFHSRPYARRRQGP